MEELTKSIMDDFTKKEHKCPRAFKSLKIIKIQDNWIIRITTMNVNIYGIKYCPYCGIKLK